jgi:hypothetical protein
MYEGGYQLTKIKKLFFDGDRQRSRQEERFQVFNQQLWLHCEAEYTQNIRTPEMISVIEDESG